MAGPHRWRDEARKAESDHEQLKDKGKDFYFIPRVTKINENI